MTSDGKGKRLSVFELGGIVELHVQGLSQRAIAADIFEWKKIYIYIYLIYISHMIFKNALFILLYFESINSFI